MNAADLTHEYASRRAERPQAIRLRIVSLLGPATILAGIAWAILQPYRLTLLHPYGQGFWWLFSEPPLFVVVAGLVFHRLVVPGLRRDFDAAARERREER